MSGSTNAVVGTFMLLLVLPFASRRFCFTHSLHFTSLGVSAHAVRPVEHSAGAGTVI